MNEEIIQDEIQLMIQRREYDDAHETALRYMMKEDNFLTLSDTKELYVYNGHGIYEPKGEQKIQENIKWLFGKYATPNIHNKIKYGIEAETYMEREELNEDINLIPVANGILNLRESRLEEFSPEKKFTFRIPVEYHVAATCPLIDKFISEIFHPDDVILAYEIIAYCLWRDFPIQKAFMLVGEGANGKSKFIKLIKIFLGKENISTRTIQELVNNRFAGASLFGKLANLNADIPEDALKRTSNFKMMTGDDEVTLEKKHKDATTFKNYAKMVYACNQLPATPDKTYAFFRRWCIIEFPNTFREDDPKTDKNIVEKITTPEELSGLLNKCITILPYILERGMSVGNTKNMEEEYIKRSDSISAFINNCIIKDVEEEITSKILYETYKEYCDYYNLDIETTQKFGRDFHSKVPFARKGQITVKVEGKLKTKQDRGYKGVKVVNITWNKPVEDNTDNTDNTLKLWHTGMKVEEVVDNIGVIGTTNLSELILDILQQFNILQEDTNLVSLEELKEMYVGREELFNKALDQLKNDGKLYEPIIGFLKEVTE